MLWWYSLISYTWGFKWGDFTAEICIFTQCTGLVGVWHLGAFLCSNNDIKNTDFSTHKSNKDIIIHTHIPLYFLMRTLVLVRKTCKRAVTPSACPHATVTEATAGNALKYSSCSLPFIKWNLNAALDWRQRDLGVKVQKDIPQTVSTAGWPQTELQLKSFNLRIKSLSAIRLHDLKSFLLGFIFRDETSVFLCTLCKHWWAISGSDTNMSL